MVFVLQFVYAIKPFLHMWDKAYLIMFYDLSDVFLDLVCNYFIENFSTHFRKGNYSVIFFIKFLNGLCISVTVVS